MSDDDNNPNLDPDTQGNFVFKSSTRINFLSFLFLSSFKQDVKMTRRYIFQYFNKLNLPTPGNSTIYRIIKHNTSFFNNFDTVNLASILDSIINDFEIPMSDDFIFLFENNNNLASFHGHLLDFNKNILLFLNNMNDEYSTHNYLELISLTIIIFFNVLEFNDPDLLSEKKLILSKLDYTIKNFFCPGYSF